MKKIILTILAVVLLSINLVSAKEVIDMKKESGVYTIPCEVNGLKLRFIFDTGASVVSISLTEVSFMLKNGYLDADDIIGTTDVAVANGSVDENYIINIKSLKIGSVTLKDVRAVVSNGLDAPLLLGQTVLDKLGHWSFRNSQLILNDYDGDDSEYSWEQLKEMLNSDNRDFALNYIRPLVRAGDDYAAYVFISNIANSTRIDRSLLQDQDVVTAMNVLSNLTDKSADDVYLDYKQLIWFCLYRIGDSDKAIKYLKQCEASALLHKYEYDEFAFDIMIACGWNDPGRIDETFAEECFNSKYYRAYITYANYLKDKKGQSKNAVQAYKRVSDAGYLPAMTKLGICYMDGIGVTQNIPQGLALLNKAAEGRDIQALDELCERYYFGYSVKKDYDKVIKYANMFGHEGACDYLNEAFNGIAYYIL
jgi:clan AA aspartic protease (TIGR02281 family)